MQYITSVERIGIAKGRLVGREEGREEGRVLAVRMLRKLLERRFGSLPFWVSEKISHAAEHKLETWVEAVLTSPTLEVIFEGDTSH